jgi:hypothetical protein
MLATGDSGRSADSLHIVVLTRDAYDDRRGQVVDGVGTEAEQAATVCIKPGDAACLLKDGSGALLVQFVRGAP